MQGILWMLTTILFHILYVVPALSIKLSVNKLLDPFPWSLFSAIDFCCSLLDSRSLSLFLTIDNLGRWKPYSSIPTRREQHWWYHPYHGLALLVTTLVCFCPRWSEITLPDLFWLNIVIRFPFQIVVWPLALMFPNVLLNLYLLSVCTNGIQKGDKGSLAPPPPPGK